MKEKKRYRLNFCSGHKRKTLYVSCADDELEGEKEAWAMKLEEETGRVWNCTTVVEVDPKGLYVGSRGGE